MTFWLGVIHDFSEPGKVKLDMIDYIQQMLDDFSLKFDEKAKVANPAASDLFETGNGEFLAENFKREFHTFVAKGLFLCGRARPDTTQAINNQQLFYNVDYYCFHQCLHPLATQEWFHCNHYV